MIDYGLFEDILGFDSTSGKERPLAEYLAKRLKAPKVETFEVGDGTLNLLFSWGRPRMVYCTHMDTVPPYIAPTVEESVIRGRGSCDAKGHSMLRVGSSRPRGVRATPSERRGNRFLGR